MRLAALGLSVFATVAFAQTLTIVTPVANQVLQRSNPGTGTLTITGKADGLEGKSVEAAVFGPKRVPWSRLGTVSNGAWNGELRNVPIGGPYEVRVRASGATTSVKDVLMGDLWILAGQSNMEGVGDLVDVQPPDPRVHSFDQADNWGVAQEPLHNLAAAKDAVHWAKGKTEPLSGADLEKYNANRKKGAGLGLPFAVEMVKRTGVPVGLVPCAHGGTSMAQWDPALRANAGKSLYGAMVRRFQAVGGKVAGVLWYQGESDANAQAAPVFQDKFEKFVAAVRADFALPEMPFYYVQLGRHINNTNVSYWNQVQEIQRVTEGTIPNSGMIAAIDTQLDDGIHVSTADQKRLGRRFALLATKTGKKGPRPVSAKFEAGPTPNSNGLVRITFSDVNGKLSSEGRISGFTIHPPTGDSVPLIFRIKIDPENPSAVLLYLGGKLPENAVVRYGYGKDPYCNLRDELDFGVPVFGPMPIDGGTTSIKPVQNAKGKILARVNERLFSDRDIADLYQVAPAPLKKLATTDPKQFVQYYAVTHHLAGLARREHLDEQPAYREQIEQLLGQAKVNDVTSHIVVRQEDQRKRYDEQKDRFKGSSFDQVRDSIYEELQMEGFRKWLDAEKATLEIEIRDPEAFRALGM